MSDPLPEFVTVAEIAVRLKLNQQTVRNWIDAGRIPHVRVGHGGRRVRVYKSDFDAFIAQNYEQKPKKAEPSIWDGEMRL